MSLWLEQVGILPICDINGCVGKLWVNGALPALAADAGCRLALTTLTDMGRKDKTTHNSQRGLESKLIAGAL